MKVLSLSYLMVDVLGSREGNCNMRCSVMRRFTVRVKYFGFGINKSGRDNCKLLITQNALTHRSSDYKVAAFLPFPNEMFYQGLSILPCGS
ncbi:hypothetical protein ACTXT7_009151 [Hymenolepis weldensis]